MASVLVALISTLGLIPQAESAVKLTTQQKQDLKYLIEEEKLARDVYNFLAKNVTSQKFGNIAKSEQTHLNLMADLLKKYGLKNPTTGMKPGEFKNKDLQKLYQSLTSEGKASTLSAFNVGIKIEELDISDLSEMLTSQWPDDVTEVLERLLSGSENHLAAFSN